MRCLADVSHLLKEWGLHAASAQLVHPQGRLVLQRGTTRVECVGKVIVQQAADGGHVDVWKATQTPGSWMYLQTKVTFISFRFPWFTNITIHKSLCDCVCYRYPFRLHGNTERQTHYCFPETFICWNIKNPPSKYQQSHSHRKHILAISPETL